MIQILSVRTAAAVALVVLGLFVLFHMLVIAGVVPSTVVWGGRLTERSQLVRAELMSVSLLILSAAVIFLNARSLASGDRGILLTVAIWAVVGLFALNTLGNIFAKTLFEKMAFTPVTLLLALLSLRLALGTTASHG